MKIFGWMHRKFHRNVDYRMVTTKKDFNSFAEEKKKAPTLTCCSDTKALLLHEGHVVPIEGLDDWFDGILSIGTFGLDHLPLSDAEYSVTEEEKTGEEEPDEVFVTNDESDDLGKATLKSSGPVESVAAAAAAAASDNPVCQFPRTEEINGEDADMDNMKKKKGERTTLADLFSADAAAGKCNAKEERKIPTVVYAKESERRAKHVRSLAKKVVPWKKGEDSPPTAKLHRLLTKIWKRKIHPELNSNEVYGTARDKSTVTSVPADGKPVLEQEMIYINGTNASVSVV